MSEVSQHDIEDMSMNSCGGPHPPETRALQGSYTPQGPYTGDDILRIMKLAKSAGVKHFSCNGLVFDFV